MKDAIKYKEYYDRYFADYASEIDRIINVFMDFNADQAEIIATLYGAWNDCIIDKRSSPYQTAASAEFCAIIWDYICRHQNGVF